MKHKHHSCAEVCRKLVSLHSQRFSSHSS